MLGRKWRALLALALAAVALAVACGGSQEAERAAAFACPATASDAACLTALAGTYEGTLEDGGTWRVTVDASGLLEGTLTDAAGVSHSLVGLVDADGRMLMSSDAGSFDGQVRWDGSVWGVWTDGDWLRGWSGQRLEGPIEVGAGGATGTGGTGSDPGVRGGCYVECNPPPDQPDAVTLRSCFDNATRTECATQALSLCATYGVGAFEQQPACDCWGIGTTACVEPSWYVIPTYQCYFHCTGDEHSRCTGSTPDGDCAAIATTACTSEGSTVAEYSPAERCPCTFEDATPACVPTWYVRTACYTKCQGTAAIYCSPDLDAATCATSAETQCDSPSLVEQNEYRSGCDCSQHDGACAWPAWL